MPLPFFFFTASGISQSIFYFKNRKKDMRQFFVLFCQGRGLVFCLVLTFGLGTDRQGRKHKRPQKKVRDPKARDREKRGYQTMWTDVQLAPLPYSLGPLGLLFLVQTQKSHHQSLEAGRDQTCIAKTVSQQ